LKLSLFENILLKCQTYFIPVVWLRLQTLVPVKGLKQNGVPQDIKDQESLGEEAEAKQTNSSMDPYAYRQHNPLQRQEASLEKNEAQAVIAIRSMSR